MNTLQELVRVRLEIDQALGLVRQDRWMLGGLRDGRLRILADSRPEHQRPFSQVLPLTHLARTCLHERRPLSVTAVAPDGPGPSPVPAWSDWEMEWPAVLYAPIGMPGSRPVGLLIVGCRREHWYAQDEIDYVAALAMSLTSTVLSLSGPLARLNAAERTAARLIGQGLSLPEIAAALKLERATAREIMCGVLRKLSLRSPRQLAERWPELTPLVN